ncbi:DNA cytosine methyltransferase [Streptomyces syringium]
MTDGRGRSSGTRSRCRRSDPHAPTHRWLQAAVPEPAGEHRIPHPTTTAPRIGSLCTGYGGLDMAVQHAFGGTLAWVADIDRGAARILDHHHPDVPNIGDITAVDWSTVEPVDILCGGYPCQPFSTAGHRRGTDDPRHIWPYIATALGVLRPRLAIFENVAAHVGLGFSNVLADLASIGFDAEWVCLRASDVGAPHQRRRLFLLAWPADTSRPGLERRGPEGTTPHSRRRTARSVCPDPAGRAPAPVSDCTGPPADAVRVRGRRCRTHRPSGRDESPLGRLRARGPAAHSEGVTERGPADQAHPVAGSRDSRKVARCGSVLPAADTEGHGRHQGQSQSEGQQGRPDSPLSSAQSQQWGPYADAVARWTPVIGRHAPRATDAMGRLNPLLVEWMMGLPPGHVTAVPGLSRSAQLKALGNGVVPLQAVTALEHLRDRATARGADLTAPGCTCP